MLTKTLNPSLTLDALADRRIGAGEEVLMAALRESRRNLLGLEAAQKALEEAIKRERMQARAQLGFGGWV